MPSCWPGRRRRCRCGEPMTAWSTPQSRSPTAPGHRPGRRRARRGPGRGRGLCRARAGRGGAGPGRAGAGGGASGTLAPAFLLAAGDVTGDGRTTWSQSGTGFAEAPASGRSPSARVWWGAAPPGERRRRRGRAGPGTSSVAVLLRPPAGRLGAVVVQDVITAERSLVFRAPAMASGAITTAVTGEGPVLVLATRNARAGTVRVEGRAVLSEQRLWVRVGSLGFDPATPTRSSRGRWQSSGTASVTATSKWPGGTRSRGAVVAADSGRLVVVGLPQANAGVTSRANNSRSEGS